MAEHSPRKLAVVLHADVVGSTALVQRNESVAHERMQDAFRRFSATIEAYGGVAHEIRGDALVAELARASDAVSAALAFQFANEDHNEGVTDDIRPEIRIGISLGEVVIADGTITGTGIVLAQRLEQLAEPGGVCIQGAAYETVPGRLPFKYESLGEQKVKGFEQPVRVYTVGLEDGQAIPPPDPAVRPDKPAPELPGKPSIAILPLTNMSGDKDQEYFSDGITEDIITALSRYSDIFVIARNSSFVYKNKSARVQDVASDLGVRYILEGSVRKVGNRVRITSQLIDAGTEHHVWAERYDRDLDDIFEIQDEITHKIVVALQAKLTTGQVAEQWAGGTQNREAWECMILGREQFFRFTVEDNITARDLFEQALEIDPNYLMAGIFLGWTHWIDARMAQSADAQLSLELAERQIAAIRATDKGRNMGGTLVASIHFQKGEYEKAVRAARSAMAFAPGPGDRAQLGWILVYVGEPAEAITELNTAMRQSPYHPSWYLVALGLAHLWNGDYSRAIEIGERYLRREPNQPLGYAHLAVIYATAGHDDEAKRTVTSLLAKFPTFRLREYARKQQYKDPLRKEHVLQRLREAGLPE